MRYLILIALCFVLTDANYFTSQNRFSNLLNPHRNRYQHNLFGSDDVDDYAADYMDEIRRERMIEREQQQCPRNNIYDENDYDDDDDEEGIRNNFDDNDQFDIQDIRGNNRQYFDIDDNIQDQDFRGNDLMKEVEDANARLASRLYTQSKDEKDDKNTVTSPASIQLALAALNRGARGNTKRQIGRVIGGRLQKQERQQVFKTLIRRLKGLRGGDFSTGTRGVKINTVTGIFVGQTTRAQQAFIQSVKRNLGASVKHCNFQHQPQQCRQTINRWVAQKTQHKINHIVPQDAITDNTKMILVNALQLKANWGPQLRRHVTKQAKFYPLDSRKVKIVEVLETQGRFKYYEDELVKIIGVPTQQQELTLYVIVPKDKDGLNDVEKLHLQDGVQLKQLLDVTDQRVRQVGVQLPKFEIKHKIDVRRTLRKQGVTDAFDSQRADFSLITGIDKNDERDNDIDDIEDTYEQQSSRFRRNPFYDTEFMNDYRTGNREQKLHLNKFIHQTTVKITESGITATSGSGTNPIDDIEQYERFGRGGGYGFGFGGDELENTFDEITGFGRRDTTGGQKIVKANRAFAFVIKHNPTNQMLMVGRVIDAAQKKVNHVQQTINNVDQL